MQIKVYGTGCNKCRQTEENVYVALEDTGIEAEVVKVTDIKDIVMDGVMVTPAVAVDGKVKLTGRVPSVEEVTAWIR